MNSITPYIVLAAVFVLGVTITVAGGVLRIVGMAFSLLAFILLIGMFIFIPPED